VATPRRASGVPKASDAAVDLSPSCRARRLRRTTPPMHAEPFRIAVPDAVLADLRERLARTRFPDEIPGSGWTYGTNLAYLGARHAARVAGIHLNMVIALPEDPQNPSLAGLTQEEIADLMAVQQFLREETGYQRIQGTKPQTLAYALNDSPAGLAAWIVEK